MTNNFKISFDKTEWATFSENEKSITLYQKAWYWDATCKSPNDWRVILLKSEDNIVAAFPFTYIKRRGMWHISTPWQVASSGIWIKTDHLNSVEAKMQMIDEVVEAIVENLPRYDTFMNKCNATMWTWHSFYWRGFSATPMYTSTLRGINSEDIKTNLSKSRRKRVNKAQREYELKKDSISIEEYWDFYEGVNKARGRVTEFSSDQFKKLMNALKEHDAMTIRAVYKEDKLVGANIILRDEMRYYHQFVAQMDNQDKIATSLALYDGICEAMDEGKIFDFEGSMIEGVCKYNMSFNPELEVLYMITKYSRKYRILHGIKQMVTAVFEK